MIAQARKAIHTRDLFLTLIERDVRLRAKRSSLATFWPVVSPFFLMSLYVFVFGQVFNADVERYPEFLLCGLIPWSFLVQALGKTITSISAEPEMVRKSPFPYELLPLGAVGGHAVNFMIALTGFVGYLAVVGHLPWALFPALVAPIAALMLLVMALSMLVSLIDVYNQDLRLVLGNILTLWFFIVPIVYRPDMAPTSMHFLRSIDPMNLIVGQFRSVLYYGRIQKPGDFVLMFVLCVGCFVGSRAIFRILSRNLPKDV
ncbi:MAG: lipopolysaccharide transport system permease protein [Actinomycetota bacterium]|jgi:ABC-type polysaccharide/polyol phosphate export permease|nr:lipopolysaccharide transport system permease protein [Actinomycetota bacterium]